MCTLHAGQAPPVVFLELEDVLVTRPECIHQLRFLPLLYRLNISDRTETMQSMWVDFVRCKVRTNVHRLHAEFRPRYVISSGIARMRRANMVSLLQRVGLACVADNLHSAWRIGTGPGTSGAAVVGTWIDTYGIDLQPIVILGGAETGGRLERADLLRRTVICPCGRGLTTPALTRARSILLAQ